jgi:hypothetical protein
MVNDRLKPPTGRVIALGRVLLGILYLAALLIDASQPAVAPVETFALLGAYIVFALGLAAVTWRNWWLDVMLAAPAHALDISLFTILVLSTAGYTSPYFTFFVFLLLSAAIRWGWRETALTAGLVTLLYFAAGLMVQPPSSSFSVNPFIVRTGHLIILSAILIWFGVNQRFDRRGAFGPDLFGAPSLESASEAALRAAVALTGAGRGVFAWSERGGASTEWLELDHGKLTGATGSGVPVAVGGRRSPFLYDIRHDRGLEGEPQEMLHVLKPSQRIDPQFIRRFKLGEGLAVPIRTETGEGIMFLEGVSALSIDSLEVGAQLRIPELPVLGILDHDEAVVGVDVLDVAGDQRRAAKQARVVESDHGRGLVLPAA